jgi:hypothetical protein
VVVSFLGARALTTSRLRGLVFFGLGVFVLSLVLSLYVLLPTEKIKSLAAGGVLLGSPHPQRDPAAEAYRRLAETCDGISATNESHIEVLGQAFTLASAAIVVEVLLWGLQLALHDFDTQKDAQKACPPESERSRARHPSHRAPPNPSPA